VTSREVAADEPASKSKLREQSIWTIIGALTYANKVHNPDGFLYRTAWRAIPGSSSTTSHTASTKQVKILEQKRQYKQALDSVEKGHAQYPQKGGRQRRWPICSRLHHSTICAQALGRWNSPN
jgi:hypothetical protein